MCVCSLLCHCFQLSPPTRKRESTKYKRKQVVASGAWPAYNNKYIASERERERNIQSLFMSSLRRPKWIVISKRRSRKVKKRFVLENTITQLAVLARKRAHSSLLMVI